MTPLEAIPEIPERSEEISISAKSRKEEDEISPKQDIIREPAKSPTKYIKKPSKIEVAVTVTDKNEPAVTSAISSTASTATAGGVDTSDTFF